ncbi:MAG: hypothetical protein NC489_36855 [Ruminococcus flavefaciens]|nr:hypothetical protein [Ruminococcus flavefaciens]
MNTDGLKILEEIRNIYQGREMTELQIAEKYGTTKENIVYILMNLGYNNTLLTKKSNSPIATAWANEKVRDICNKLA